MQLEREEPVVQLRELLAGAHHIVELHLRHGEKSGIVNRSIVFLFTIVGATQLKEQLVKSNEQLMRRQVDLQSLVLNEVSAAANRMERQMQELTKMQATSGELSAAESSAASERHAEQLATMQKMMLLASESAAVQVAEKAATDKRLYDLLDLLATRSEPLVHKCIEQADSHGPPESISRGGEGGGHPWVIDETKLAYETELKGRQTRPKHILGQVQPPGPQLCTGSVLCRLWL